MVNGLDTFAEAFRPFRSRDVLIGGSACDWIGELVGAVFRQTKDLDRVVCAETVTPEFGAAAEPYDTAPLGIREPYPEVLARIRSLFSQG